MNRVVFALLVLVTALPVAAEDRWEKVIQNFEQRDAENPPAPGGIVFVGSSSIRFWDTDKAFPDHGIINRGFGGSQTFEVVRYMDRIVLPYAPRLVVLYAGDNDVAYGKTHDRIVSDTKAFIDAVHESLPETRIVYIAIKPSILRWGMVDRMRAINATVSDMAEVDPLLTFLDIDAPMIGEDGKPMPELFIKDGLHLSAAGYELWNDLIRPHLGAPKKE